MDLLLKAALGAAVVVILAALAKTRNYYIAGLVPLFPTFALIAHYIVGKGRSLDDLKTTILFGMWSIIPYFVYLATLYVMVDRLRLEASFPGSGCRGLADRRDDPGQRLGAPARLSPAIPVGASLLAKPAPRSFAGNPATTLARPLHLPGKARPACVSA